MNVPAIYLETERMILRELRLSDEDLIVDLDSDPEVMKYLTDGVPSTRERVRAALARTQELYRKHNGVFGFWAAIEKATGDFMGWFHFRPSKKDPNNIKRIELGYRLKKSFWKRGFATEGGRALIEKGFSELGVETIFAATMENNFASRRVMEKAGLKFSNRFIEQDFPGMDKAAVEYSVSKHEWS
jgi:RimJ/RimL family protein N-acetyltransferase